jgi:hypothetical protein
MKLIKMGSKPTWKTIGDIIETLNKLYKSNNLRIRIDDDSYEMKSNSKKGSKSNVVSNFFFYPVQKLFTFDGIKKIHVGYRICFVKANQKGTKLKATFLKLSNEMLEKENWLKKSGLDGFTIDNQENIKKIRDVTLKFKNVELQISTSVLGWVENQGNGMSHYVPITDYKQDGIRCKKVFRKNFKLNFDDTTTEADAFQKVWDLLNITTKKVSIPLISFTIIYSLLSKIQKQNKDYPKFMMCLQGNNKTKEVLSNLFGNIYNRSSQVYIPDSRIHGYRMSKKEIPKKMGNVRDAIFIGQLQKDKEESFYIDSLENDTQGCGVLLLSEKVIPLNHAIIGFDVNNLELDESIIKFHEENPDVFSTWFISFINYMQSLFNNYGYLILRNEQSLLAEKNSILKLYEVCKKEMVQPKLKYDINKLRHYCWLFLGYKFLIDHGINLGVLTETEKNQAINSAIEILGNSCLVDLSYDPVKNDSLRFINAFNQIIEDGDLVEDKSPIPNAKWGWYSGDLLEIKSKKIYEKINDHLIKNEQYSLSSKSISIFQYLLDHEIMAERNKEGMGWGFQKTKEDKVIRFSREGIKKFLEENGYKLLFDNSMS